MEKKCNSCFNKIGKYVFLSLIILLGNIAAYAQQGAVYLYNYDISSLNQTCHIYSFVQAASGDLFFAGDNGIIHYDGVDWEIIEMPWIPSVLVFDSLNNGNVFVGGAGGYGMLFKDNLGNEKFKDLSDSSTTITAVFDIICAKDFIYFISRQALIKMDARKFSVRNSWKAKSESSFLGMYAYHGDIYINVSSEGVQKVMNEGLTPVQGFEALLNNRIVFSFPDGQHTLIGTSGNKLYIVEKDKLKLRGLESQEYLDLNIISCGILLGNKKIAIGTLSGGCLVIDMDSGKTLETINYQNGLSDDEVYSLGKDHLHGLWINHGSGITRAAFTLPVRNFSTYPGLEGNILTVRYINNYLYVGTSEGLFLLNKVEKYADISYLVEEQKTVVRKKTPITRTVVIVKEKVAVKEIGKAKSKIGGLVDNVFGRKKKTTMIENVDTVITTSDGTDQVDVDTAQVVQKVPIMTDQSSKVYILHSVEYIYKKVREMNGKCLQLTELNGKLIALTNTGIYEVDGSKVKLIINKSNCNFLYPSVNNKDMLFVGMRNGLELFKRKNERWMSEQVVLDNGVSVFSLLEMKDQYWIGGDNILALYTYREDSGLVEKSVFSVGSSYTAKVICRNIQGTPVFFVEGQVYVYDESSNSIVHGDAYQSYLKQNSNLHLQDDDFTWVVTKGDWVNMNAKDDPDRQASYLFVIFKSIDLIYKDMELNSWLISDNQLYKIDRSDSTQQSDFFTAYIKKIKGKEGRLLGLDQLKLDYNSNSLTFSLANTFYLGEYTSYYQYKLDGLDNEWSDWQKETVITFPFLPAGDYSLMVRAKNIFGQESQIVSVPFSVEKPIWQKGWFYAIWLVLLLALFYAILRFRERSLKERQRILEEQVAQRTKELAIANVELEKLSIVASETDNSVLIMDPSGEIEWVNAGFTKLFGYEWKEFREKFSGNILTSSSNPTIKDDVQTCLTKKKSVHYISLVKTKDKREIWVQSTLTPILDQTGMVSKLISIDADITRIKDAEAEINKQNNHILSSITYASRIQKAILPEVQKVQNYFKDSFILFKPRDIVSGDFYWYSEVEDNVFIVGADCTGHGVPGAFMSMIGTTLLNEIVNEKKIFNPTTILGELNVGIIRAMHHDLEARNAQNDGMDISFCRVNKKKQEIEIACANHSPVIIDGDEIIAVKGSPYAIGETRVVNKGFKYETTTFPIKKDMCLYMFSDGFHDQFGGPDNRKYMKKNFRELLFKYHTLPLEKQRILLDEQYHAWLNFKHPDEGKEYKQIDDVLIIGIRF